jgi:hypothetical protein
MRKNDTNTRSHPSWSVNNDSNQTVLVSVKMRSRGQQGQAARPINSKLFWRIRTDSSPSLKIIRQNCTNTRSHLSWSVNNDVDQTVLVPPPPKCNQEVNAVRLSAFTWNLEQDCLLEGKKPYFYCWCNALKTWLCPRNMWRHHFIDFIPFQAGPKTGWTMRKTARNNTYSNTHISGFKPAEYLRNGLTNGSQD